MPTNNGSTDSDGSVVMLPSTPATPPEGLNLDIKYVDHRYDDTKDAWEYQDTQNSDVPAELVQPVGAAQDGGDDSWEKYCFVVVRRYSRKSFGEPQSITFKIIIKSPYLRTACFNVMQNVRGISWVSQPLTIDPKLLIMYFPKLEAYVHMLSAHMRSEEEDRMLSSLRILLQYIQVNYSQTLSQINSLVSHGEITFDLLYYILIPGTIIVRRCPITRETRALRLLSASKQMNNCGQFYSLECIGLEEMVGDDDDDDDDEHGMVGWSDDDLKASKLAKFGWASAGAIVSDFSGVEKINTLSAYPFEFHSDTAGLRNTLVTRGRKWASLAGVHHMQYKGTTVRGGQWNEKPTRYNVKSRVMIDKANFVHLDANYGLPSPGRAIAGHNGPDTLTEDELLLASPIVYGFSLSDKMWLEYNVNHIQPIEWNNEAFEGLVLPADRKTLLRSLIEAHSQLAGGFDDFVRGKGQGLVINLFGPPGVGKTLSAEATSEHLQRPLYIVGSGDLGTSAHALDRALEQALELAACWNAILLIDEADVFLEQRSLHDMERNAMVAVFLRHVEYYRGILFLTTNRIRTFDEAFLSRIHVALHFSELTPETKAQIWRAFLKRAGVEERELTDALVERLAIRDVNGRQIKNACRTATSLALSRKEKVGARHLDEALNAMEQFVREFTAMQPVE